MARSKSPLRVYAEYVPTLAFLKALRALSFDHATAIAGAALRVVLAGLPSRRRRLMENLREAFPERSNPERKAIARASISSLAKGISVFVRLPDIVKDLDRWAVLEGWQHLEQAHKAGKGVLLVTAHYGCWEIAATLLMRSLPKGGAVMRPLDNPMIEELVKGLRSAGQGMFIAKRQVLREGLRWLRDNGTLGILMDQNFAGGGVFVPFFHRLAATSPVISVLARRSGAPVLSMHARWDGHKTRVIIGPPLPFSDNPDPDVAVALDTARMTALIESWVRQDPGQWLWLHNRWKRRPRPGERLVHSDGRVTVFDEKTPDALAPGV